VEDIIDQKINKAMDMITHISNSAEDRFFQLETNRLQLQRELEAQQAQLMDIAQSQLAGGMANNVTAKEKEEVLSALAAIHGDIEAMRTQQRTAFLTISNQKEQHQRMEAAIEELRQQHAEFSNGEAAPVKEVAALNCDDHGALRQLQLKFAEVQEQLVELRAEMTVIRDSQVRGVDELLTLRFEELRAEHWKEMEDEVRHLRAEFDAYRLDADFGATQRLLQANGANSMDLSGVNLEATIQQEHDSRTRDAIHMRTEFNRSIDAEREARVRQGGEIRSDFMRLINQERDDRTIESSDLRQEFMKFMREWHTRRNDALDDQIDERPQRCLETPHSCPKEQPQHENGVRVEEETPGFMGRLFGRS